MRNSRKIFLFAIILSLLGWLIIPALEQNPIRRRPPNITGGAPLTNKEVLQEISASRSPKGRAVRIDGQIVQDPQYSGEGTDLQVYVKWGTTETAVIVRYPATLEVTQGDFVRVKGKVAGSFRGVADDGSAINTLEIKASSITSVAPEAALAPPEKTWTKPVKLRKREVSVSVDKIEFSETETRLYLTAKNSGPANVVVQISNSFLKQKELYEPLAAVPTGYREMPVDLSANSAGAGVVLFPPLDGSSPMDFSLPVAGPDWETDFNFTLRP